MTRRLAYVVICVALASGVAPAAVRAQSAADLVVRLSQVEAQMRQMAGQIEELQFQNQQLRDQVKRMQDEVDQRAPESKGASASTPKAPGYPAAPPRQIVPGAPAAVATIAPAPRAAPRGDVYDPQADPNAPGAPRPLGSPDSAAPAPVRRSAPIPGSIVDDLGTAPGTPLDLSGAGGPPPAPIAPARPAAPGAATGTASDRADFDNAYAYIQQRQYEQAEMGFRSFLQSHPKSKLTSDATYWLGESYLQRQRYRDAAEQFLKITTSYSTSAKGAEGMLKLGISLRGLGASDQACATFAEVERKYPSARPAFLKDVQREQQRAKCPS